MIPPEDKYNLIVTYLKTKLAHLNENTLKYKLNEKSLIITKKIYLISQHVMVYTQSKLLHQSKITKNTKYKQTI